jgi:hypothetical protein
MDGTMATVADEPLWEFHPLGMRVEGRDAVRTIHEYQFEHILPRVTGSMVRLVGYDHLNLIKRGLVPCPAVRRQRRQRIAGDVLRAPEGPV